jgi:sec-independent protein translocase protein TatA
MPIKLGPAGLIIILVLVILLFGAGRIGKIAKELGTSITAFKDGIKGNKEEK